MLSFSFLDIFSQLNQFLWPLFRIAGFFMAAPIFGARLVPVRIRMVLALSVTAVIYQTIDEVPDVDALSLAGATIAIYQVVIGIMMGFTLQILFQIGAVGGQIIAMQNGLGFAQMMDPVNGVNVATISQFFIISANLIFLSMNGHLLLFKMLLESFQNVPIGPHLFPSTRFLDLAAFGTWMFQGALLIALPAVAALLAVNISFGVMARVAPQLNIFAIGFPFTLMLGLIVLRIVFGGFAAQFTRFVYECVDMLGYLISAY